MFTRRQLASLFVMLLLVVLPVAGQINRANLNGTVTDPSGASVPRATVEVVVPDTGFTRQTITGNAGVYSMTSLPTGTYDLRVTGKGFKTFQESGIELSVGQTRTVNVPLAVGSSTSTLEVKALAPALDSNSAEIATVIQAQQVEDIPLNGRDWSLLMTLAPGAVNLGAGGQRDLRFVGRGIDDSNYTYDGLDATGVQEQSQKVGVRLAISLESIAEFRVSSSVYTADQGGSAGAIVSISIEDGDEHISRRGFRVFAQRRLRRTLALRYEHPALPIEPVRRQPGRAHQEGPHFLLFRLRRPAAAA